MVFYGDKERGEYGEERSSYVPKQEHYDIAKEYGVVISPSTNKLKKLNVYKPNIAGELVGSADKDETLASYRKSIKGQKSRAAKYGRFDGMLKIAEIGGMYQDGVPYGDYYTYLENPTDRYGNEVEPEVARQRYLIRHQHENKLNEKFFETIDEDDEVKQQAIDLGSPSFWADVILWGKKANEQKLVMKKDFAKLDQLSATHAITDDFEFDMSFAKIIDGRIKKLKAFIEFSKKFEKKNQKIIQDYLRENEDDLRVDTYYQDHYGYKFTDREWSSKFYTTKQFKNKNMEKIKQLYYAAIENTKIFERQLIFNQKILKDYNKRLNDDKLKQLGQNIATNQQIAKLAEEANQEAIKKADISGELLEDIKKKFESITEEVEKQMGEAAEYGNEGGKIFAKTIKLKDGGEINVLLDEKGTFNLNSLVMMSDGEFNGTLRDFYDQFKTAKLSVKDATFKGVKEKSTKKEYKKVLNDFMEFKNLLFKLVSEFSTKYDVDFEMEDNKQSEVAFQGSKKEVAELFDTADKLMEAYAILEMESQDFYDTLPKGKPQDDYNDQLYKIHKKVDFTSGIDILPEGTTSYGLITKGDRKYIAKNIESSKKKLEERKAKEKLEQQKRLELELQKKKAKQWKKENNKVAKKLYNLHALGEDLYYVWDKLYSSFDGDDKDDKRYELRKVSNYTINTTLLNKSNDNVRLYTWSDRKMDSGSEKANKYPTTPKEWIKPFEMVVGGIKEVNDAIKKGYKHFKKKIPKKVKEYNDKIDELEKEIKDKLDEYVDYKEIKITTKGAKATAKQPTFDSDSD
jgi:hypothetical protein